MGMLLDLINYGVVVFLGAVSVYFILLNLKTIVLPQKTGVLVSFTGRCVPVGMSNGCLSCGAGHASAGRMGLPVEVRLDDGSVVAAETSPCCLCLDKMAVGCRVGLSDVGSRKIAYRMSWISERMTKLLSARAAT
jgi:hypothetical protein